MVKIAENEHVFDHRWEDVTLASWRKYPHPNASHVLSVDITDRAGDQSTGILRSTRLISMQQQCPGWVARILGANSDRAFVHEISECDHKYRVMSLKSQNVTFGNLLTVEETCTYQPHPTDSNKTIFKQEVAVTAVGLNSLVTGKAESTMLGVFQSTASKGKEVLDDVCRMVVGEQIAALA